MNSVTDKAIIILKLKDRKEEEPLCFEIPITVQLRVRSNVLMHEFRLSGLKGACLEHYVCDHSASLEQFPLKHSTASVTVFFFHNVFFIYNTRHS